VSGPRWLLVLLHERAVGGQPGDTHTTPQVDCAESTHSPSCCSLMHLQRPCAKQMYTHKRTHVHRYTPPPHTEERTPPLAGPTRGPLCQRAPNWRLVGQRNHTTSPKARNRGNSGGVHAKRRARAGWRAQRMRLHGCRDTLHTAWAAWHHCTAISW